MTPNEVRQMFPKMMLDKTVLFASCMSLLVPASYLFVAMGAVLGMQVSCAMKKHDDYRKGITTVVFMTFMDLVSAAIVTRVFYRTFKSIISYDGKDSEKMGPKMKLCAIFMWMMSLEVHLVLLCLATYVITQMPTCTE